MRRRTPTVLQLEAAECGAAALAMVLGYYGRHMSLDELRVLCGVSRDGAKASTILRAARSLGLDAKGLKAEPEHFADFNGPAIAFVNFNHFVVVEGMHQDKVFINDPANGHRTETLEEFSESFTGVVLTFEPGAGFEKGDMRPAVLPSLWQRLRGFRGGLVYLFLISLLLVIPGIVMPFFNQMFVDSVLVQGMTSWVVPLLIGMLITALIQITLSLIQSFTMLRLGEAMRMETGRALLDHMLKLPIAFFDQRSNGEVADRIRLNEGLVSLLSGGIIQAAINLVLAIFYLTVMLWFSLPLTLIIIVLVSLNIVSLMLTARLVSEKSRKLSVESGKLQGARISGLKDIETYKASGGESMLFTKWAGMQANVLNISQEAARIGILARQVPALIGTLVVLTTLIGGGLMVMEGRFTLGQLVAFQSLALSFSGPVNALAGFGAQLQELRSFLARLDDTLLQPADAVFDPPEEQSAQDDTGAIALRNARFGYNPVDTPLFENLSLNVEKGERIAIVGGSGSGKSTLGKIIAGLAHIQDGTLTINAREATAWSRAERARHVGYVSQDVVLFRGTIRDNLTLWNTSVSEQDMRAGAAAAQILNVIEARPGGFDAEVEERGQNFSGGEQQRLELARAFAARPRLLILDEATSALDPLTEEKVLAAIRDMGITCLMIAHRLSAIRDCDRIIVLKRGEIVEEGPHSELIARNGAYRQLVEA